MVMVMLIMMVIEIAIKSTDTYRVRSSLERCS